MVLFEAERDSRLFPEPATSHWPNNSSRAGACGPIFFGRFIALLRILAGPLAGALQLRCPYFLAANAAGAVCWAEGTTAVVYFLAWPPKWMSVLLGGTGTGGHPRRRHDQAAEEPDRQADRPTGSRAQLGIPTGCPLGEPCDRISSSAAADESGATPAVRSTGTLVVKPARTASNAVAHAVIGRDSGDVDLVDVMCPQPIRQTDTIDLTPRNRCGQNRIHPCGTPPRRGRVEVGVEVRPGGPGHGAAAAG